MHDPCECQDGPHGKVKITRNHKNRHGRTHEHDHGGLHQDILQVCVRQERRSEQG